jgi:hypothetical protein
MIGTASPGADVRRPALLRCTLLAGLMLILLTGRSWSQFSPRDGYASDGSSKLQFELAPYVWLPATSSSFNAGSRGRISGNVTTPVPSIGDLAQSLHGAFMGYGLARYGPWSAELDIQWVDASQGKTTAPDRFGRSAHLSLSASYVRVAPGFGYQVLNSAIGSLPFTVDARAGFAWFSWSGKISSQLDTAGVSPSGSFVQPWLGLRGSFYPAARWRIELAALGQGFGVGGGSWGWGTSLIASYAVSQWFDVSAGFRALHSSRFNEGRAAERSFEMTSYGPVLGVGFRF